MRIRFFRMLLVGTAAAIVPVAFAGDEAEPDHEPATIKIRGVGWLKARDFGQTLRLLEPEGRRTETVGAAFIEDAVVLLQSALEGDGFLRATGSVVASMGGEPVGEFSWVSGEVPIIPRAIEADRVVFRVEPGQRYWFRSIEGRDLTAIDPSDVENYFVDKGFLFGGGAARVFTPGRLRNGVGNIAEQLQRMGYADARVTVASEKRDTESGAVDVVIEARQGPLNRVGGVTVSGTIPAELEEDLRTRVRDAAGVIYSVVWRQDFVQAIRNLFYDYGYPSADVRLEHVGTEDIDGGRVLDFHVEAASGAQVRVGEVRFEGDAEVLDRVMRRAVPIEPGDLFRRSEVQQGRLRLGALGAFSSVRTEVSEVEPGLWNLTFVVSPGEMLDVSLLAGWGSYEQLRGGITVQHGDIFGRAHRGRFQLIQSLKSTHTDYIYTMPQFLGSRNDASVRLFGLVREEVSFERQEFGASFGVRRRLTNIDADAGLRYQFESVRAEDFTGETDEDVPDDSRLGTIIFDLTRDRLDNPISPKAGHLFTTSFETAAKVLGSQVGYQRIELGLGWHKQVGSQSFVHAGIRQSTAWALGGSAAIPFPRRFFPGGEDSLRGYTEGEASPRDAQGNHIGAETVTILHLEFEQALRQELSGVLFVDAGVMAADLNDFPGDQQRVSVGIGLRYNTVIGPLRLEYGHNVVRESGDPSGSVHFALGFPF